MKTFTFRLVTYLKYSLILAMLFSSIGSLYAQDHRVSGTVTHEGTPLLGATIMIKDTQRGTTADMDGYFELQAQDDDVLVVSYLGYKTKEVAIQGSTFLTIELIADADMLDTVELTGGYYSTNERERTGNIQTIQKDLIENQIVFSPLDAIQGFIPGVEVIKTSGLVGSKPRIIIRGQNSLRGAQYSQPLIIIDGVPQQTESFRSIGQIIDPVQGVDPFMNINPNSIESITVLKDADATAIYGSRGANGVIIINTKKGEQGKTRYNVNLETGTSWIGRFPKLLNTEQYLEIRREALDNDGLIPNEFNAPDLTLWDQNKYTDWQRELLGERAEFKKTNFNITGGNEYNVYRVGVNLIDQKTVFGGDFGNTNLSADLNLTTYDKNSRFTMTNTVNLGRFSNKLFNSNTYISDAKTLAPNAPKLYNEDGSINWELNSNGLNSWENPMSHRLKLHKLRNENINWSNSIGYKLFTDLELKVNSSYSNLIINQEIINPMESISPLHISYGTKNSLVEQVINNESYNIEPQINYTRIFNDIRINTLFGGTFYQQKLRDLSFGASDFYTDELLNNLQFADRFILLTDTKKLYKYTSAFGRFGADYKNKLFMNITLRRDGSSRFGENYKFGNFGAIGGAWVFSDSPIIQKKLPWINFGKLRASYGITGNDQIPDYGYFDSYMQITVHNGSLAPGGLIPTRLANQNYRWEKTEKLEFGIDLSLFNNSIDASIIWFRNLSGNQLISYSLPYTTGFGSIMRNFPAVIENKGWEFSYKHNVISSSTWGFDYGVNLSIPKNKLKSFPNIENTSYASTKSVGEPVNAISLFEFKGIDLETGEYLFNDVNNDGIINYEDKKIFKNMDRRFSGSLYTNLRFKKFSLRTHFVLVKKEGILLESPSALGSMNNLYNGYNNTWKPSQSDSKYGKASTRATNDFRNFRQSTGNWGDKSFIRLQNISLQYLLTDSVEKFGLENVIFSLNAQNLFTISPYKLSDPETSQNQLPLLKSVNLGVAINF